MNIGETSDLGGSITSFGAMVNYNFGATDSALGPKLFWIQIYAKPLIPGHTSSVGR